MQQYNKYVNMHKFIWNDFQKSSLKSDDILVVFFIKMSSNFIASENPPVLQDHKIRFKSFSF